MTPAVGAFVLHPGERPSFDVDDCRHSCVLHTLGEAIEKLHHRRCIGDRLLSLPCRSNVVQRLGAAGRKIRLRAVDEIFCGDASLSGMAEVHRGWSKPLAGTNDGETTPSERIASSCDPASGSRAEAAADSAWALRATTKYAPVVTMASTAISNNDFVRLLGIVVTCLPVIVRGFLA